MKKHPQDAQEPILSHLGSYMLQSWVRAGPRGGIGTVLVWGWGLGLWGTGNVFDLALNSTILGERQILCEHNLSFV